MSNNRNGHTEKIRKLSMLNPVFYPKILFWLPVENIKSCYMWRICVFHKIGERYRRWGLFTDAGIWYQENRIITHVTTSCAWRPYHIEPRSRLQIMPLIGHFLQTQTIIRNTSKDTYLGVFILLFYCLYTKFKIHLYCHSYLQMPKQKAIVWMNKL